jgi:CheY-like chemotaxis protein
MIWMGAAPIPWGPGRQQGAVEAPVASQLLRIDLHLKRDKERRAGCVGALLSTNPYPCNPNVLREGHTMNPRILLVMPAARRERMLRLLDGHSLDLSVADNLREVRAKLTGPDAYDLVLVDEDLPDGCWRDLLQLIAESPTMCEVVVCSRFGDERLWAEVIQCGAFDLLAEPFERLEVQRILESALSSHYMQRFGRRPTVARAS